MGNTTRYVFDLDGTLVDAFEDLLLALNHALVRLGARRLEMDELRERIGHGARHLVAASCTHVGIDDARHDEALAIFRAAYRGHCSTRTRAYDGVASLLAALGPSRAAVLTNKPRGFALSILSDLGLRAHVGPVVGGDSLPVRKPDPSTLRFVARLWEAPVEQLTMVGDSLVDAAVARAAGVPFVGVTWGQHSGDVLRGAGAERVIAAAADLLAD